jgi:hypothetical protein
VHRWRERIQQTHWAKRKWRSHEPYAIARPGKSFVIQFTVNVDVPEEGSDVTFVKVRNIYMVKRYGYEVVIVVKANKFQEV